MKRTTTAITALSSLLLVGCNALDRVGSQSVVFDSDPFAQIDNAQASASNNQQQPLNQSGEQMPGNMTAMGQTQAGRVNVGNLGGPVPPNYAGLQQQAPPQSMQAQYNYNPQPPAGGRPPAASMNQPGYAARPANTAAMTGPAARAAETAAMLAFQPQGQQPIQQTSYETAAPMMADVSSLSPADFAPDPFGGQAMQTADGRVPMPPEAQFNPDTSLFELSDADLEIPRVEEKQNPRMFPGTNIPMPAGRVSMPNVLPSEWEPAQTPAPAAVTAPIETQPVFSPPANQPAVTPEPTPVHVTPIKPIQDSTNQSKWRAVRRG